MNTKYTDFLKPEKITLALIWEAYSKAVIPDVSQLQHDEMKKAFFSGFLECLKVMADVATSLPEEKSTGILTRLNSEGHAFFDRLMDEYHVEQAKKGGKQ
jgi:hypothetical protein